MTKNMLLVAAFLLAIASLSNAGALSGPALTAADQTLMKYMMRTKFSDDPEVSIRCFNHYMPMLNQITEEFSRCFQQCGFTATDRLNQINEAAIGDRYQIEKAADGVCVRLDACNDLENVLDFFDCISGQGSEDQKTIYWITQNSTELGSNLREQRHLIIMDKAKCQNKSERAYVEDTALTYHDLDLCLKGADIPTEPPTEQPTTDAPVSTTIQSTSDATNEPPGSTAPDTTEQAEQTTVAPPLTTTLEPIEVEDLPIGRGQKILSGLRKFWRN